MGRILFLYGLLGSLPAYAQDLEVCEAQCGLFALTHYCAEFRDYTDWLLKELPRTKQYTPAEVCEALNGWLVLVHPPDDACGGDSWLLGHYMCAYGYTDRKNKHIWVVQENWHSSSLAHEMIHALDVSLQRPVGHCYWKKKGIHRYLRQVSRVVRDAPSEDVCPNPVDVQ